MPEILFKSVPLILEQVTLALESGVDGIIVSAKDLPGVESLARCRMLVEEELQTLALTDKQSENEAITRLKNNEALIISRGFEVIPMENILAAAPEAHVRVEVESFERAALAAGILERGVNGLVALPEAVADLKKIVAALKVDQKKIELRTAVIRAIRPAGLGSRVCIDTTSMLKRGQGILTGNSSAFTFLVHAETEFNAYVAARPFRVNAGAVHAYALMPEDRTRYLEEIRGGDEVLIVSADGSSSLATVGRVKNEVRPMLLIEAASGEKNGSIFLQNAETIRLTRPDGSPASVVELREGDEVLCRVDSAGRHFGMRISENISEN